jgi:hypothetical protein
MTTTAPSFFFPMLFSNIAMSVAWPCSNDDKEALTPAISPSNAAIRSSIRRIKVI